MTELTEASGEIRDIEAGELGSRGNPYEGAGAMSINVIVSNAQVLAADAPNIRAYFVFNGEMYTITADFRVDTVKEELNKNEQSKFEIVKKAAEEEAEERRSQGL